MSLPMNSDFEVVSNAEAAAVIDKYSSAMLQMTLQEILTRKNISRISPLANIVDSYEMNCKADIEKFSFMQSDIMERRTELYNMIMDMICQYHNLSWVLPSNADIYTLARTAYVFLVSNFYNTCIAFHSAWLHNESSEIIKMLDAENFNTAHQYAKKRYTGKMVNDGVIHTHLNKILDIISAIDISITDIIRISYININKDASELLNASLTDNGDFYKDFYVPAVGGYNRADAVTNIRFMLLPSNGNGIMDYIS